MFFRVAMVHVAEALGWLNIVTDDAMQQFHRRKRRDFATIEPVPFRALSPFEELPIFTFDRDRLGTFNDDLLALICDHDLNVKINVAKESESKGLGIRGKEILEYTIFNSQGEVLWHLRDDRSKIIVAGMPDGLEFTPASLRELLKKTPSPAVPKPEREPPQS